MLIDRTEPAKDRAKDLFYFTLFLLLFLSVFREFFFTGHVFFERDTTVIEIPARKLTAALLREGNFALWTDAYGGGQPFLANPKNAVFYPATLLYLILPLFTAFKLYYLIHVLLGWLGLYALCRSYALSERASFLGASLFAFSGMYLSSFEFYNHIAAVAWMPWVLLLLNRGPRTSSGRSRFIPLTILWALLILAGSPEIVVITVILAGAQAFLRPGGWRKKIVSAALPFATACLLSAVQLVPSFEMLTQTERKYQSVNWPLELLQLPNMAFPDVLGNDREPGHHDFWGWHLFDRHFPLYYSLYTGFGALLLAFFGLKRPWDGRRKVFVGSFVVLFLLACGRYSPFFFLYRITPFLSSIRYPVKFFLGSMFCLSVLAALGFEEAVAGRALGRKALRALAITAGTALTLFLIFKGQVLSLINSLLVIEKQSSYRDLGLSIGTGLVLLAVYAAVFVLLSGPRSRGAVVSWGLIAIAVIDPAYHNRAINPTVPASFFEKPPIMNDLKPPMTVYRADDYFIDRREKSRSNISFLAYYRGTLFPLSAMAEGVKYVFNNDFYGTYPRRHMELERSVKKLPPELQLKILCYLGCRYFISDSPMFSKDTARQLQVEGFPVYVETIAARTAAPYLVHAARRAATPETRLGIFVSADFDPLKEAVTEGDPGLTGPPGEPWETQDSLLVKREVQGRGWYDTDLARRGIAVFPGNYARGWRAWIDGRKAEVFEANLFSKGVLVPPGRHEVVLRYLPGSFVLGAALSLLTAALLLAGSLAVGVRVRKRVRPASV